MFSLTGGELSGERSKRVVLFTDVAKKIRAKPHIGSFSDGKVGETSDLVAEIEKEIKLVFPDILLIPSSNDTHQDNRAVAKAALSAARGRVSEVYAYEILGNTISFTPQYFVDITDEMEVKREVADALSETNEKLYGIADGVAAQGKKRAFDQFLNERFVEAFEVLYCIER